MACYKPLKAARQAEGPLFFFGRRDGPESYYKNNRLIGSREDFMWIACGQCTGCLLDRALAWAVRSEHEAHFHDENYFVTLTFNDKYLPADLSIRSWHLQDFWKRVRHALDEETSFFDGAFSEPPRFKYLACGEYGDENFRPHYHASVFGLPLKSLGDLRYHSRSGDFELSRSSFLEKHWPWGFSLVAPLTFETAGYVARYNFKKLMKSRDEYAECGLLPERLWVSKGVGRQWYETYSAETWRDDMIVNSRGFEMSVPRTYLRWLEKVDLERAELIKAERIPDFDTKMKILDDLHNGRHDVALLVKEASLKSGRLDRSR